MPEIVAARLGYGWGWNLGEGGWNTGWDINAKQTDTYIGMWIISDALATPPGSPNNGDTYIVAASPTGAWSGQAGKIAAYQAGTWYFYGVAEGLRAWFVNHTEFMYNNGTAWVAEPSGSGITSLVASAPLTGGTITSTGTLGLAIGAGLTNASGTLVNNGVIALTAGTNVTITGTDTINATGGGIPLDVTDGTNSVANTGTIDIVGAVVSGSAGNATITITGASGVTNVVVQGGPFLANSTITSTGTIDNSSATLTAHGVLIGEGTGAVVATAAMTNGQLLIGSTGADPAPHSVSGDVAINSGGTATVATVAGGFTPSVHSQITVNATAGTNTMTLAATTSNVFINGPSTGGAVTLALAAATLLDQRIVMNISQGATPATWSFGTGFNFGTTVPAPTITAVAGKRDVMGLINNVGTVFDFTSINQGFSP